jgi:hypothetical protein
MFDSCVNVVCAKRPSAVLVPAITLEMGGLVALGPGLVGAIDILAEVAASGHEMRRVAVTKQKTA